MSLTLVTGFWPQRHSHVRSSLVYVRLFEQLVRDVAGRIPIVVRSDPSIEDDVRRVIERAARPDRILLRSKPYGELRYGAQLGRFEDLRPASNSFTLRDTIEYAAIVWSKPAAVAEVAAENPFDTTHFGWIDFGLAHIASLQKVDWDEVALESTRTDRIRLCERQCTTAQEVADRWHFYSANSARVCGGFLTGSKESFDRLSSAFEDEIGLMTPTGSYVLEEQILSAVSATREGLVERWYGDYDGVLENVRYVRTNAAIVVSNLEQCRKDALWEEGRAIASVLLESAADAGLRLDAEQCFHLLDAGLACAVETDRDLAMRLGRTAVSLSNYSRIGAGMMRGVWRRSMQQSLERCGLHFKSRPWTWEEFAAQPDFHVWMACF